MKRNCVALISVMILSIVYRGGAMSISNTYTNLSSGATLDVSSDLKIKNTAVGGSGSSGFTGISYSDATLTGSGNITVENNVSSTNRGIGEITGLSGSTMTNGGFTGNIKVVNDRSDAPLHESNMAYAYGIDSDWAGDWTGTLEVSATGGTALGEDAYSEAHVYGVYGDITGNLTGTIETTVKGGTATGDYGWTHVCAHAVYGDVDGDVTGKIISTATGGNSTAIEYGARANANAIGIDGSVGGSVTESATITATSAGGTAVSTGCKAKTFGRATGINGDVDGDFRGKINVSAHAGDSTSYTDTTANYTYASGIDGRVAGAFTGTLVVKALGGMSTYADSGGCIYAQSYGVSGVSNFSGVVESSAFGGTMIAGTASSCSPHAYGEAYGIDDDVYGDLSGRIVVTAKGGTVTAASTASSEAYAEAYGVYGDVDGVISGTIIVTATAGLTNGVTDTAEAYGIYAQNGDLTFNNASVSAQAYENDGTLIPKSCYAIYNAGDLTFAGGFNRMVGDIWANSADITAGTMDLTGSMDVSGDLNVGTGAAMGVRVGGADTSIVGVGGTATFNPSSTVIIRDDQNATVSSVLGQTIVDAGTLAGDTNITYSMQTIFDLTVVATNNTLLITGATVKPQDSSVPKQMLATAASANALMGHVSRNSSVARTQVRNGSAGGSPFLNQPDGAGGPSILSGEWTGYIRQFNDLGGQDSDGSKAGFDWNTAGYTIGMERLIDDSLIIGLAMGQSFTDLDGKRDSGGGKSKMTSGTLYGNLFDDEKYLEGGVFVAQADNENLRVDAGGNHYKGDYDSTLLGCWLEAGCALDQSGDTRIEPYLRTSYISGNHDKFTEKGGAMPMTIGENNTDNWTVEGGARFSRTMELDDGGSLRGELKAGLQTELLDNQVSVNSVIGGASQKLNGPEADRVALALGLSLDWALDDKLTVGASYQPTIAENWYNHTIDFMLKYEF